MNIQKPVQTVAVSLFLLSFILLVGCDDDVSITEPETTYVLGVGTIEGPSSIALGDTLWITFTDIPMGDSCHQFHEMEVEFTSSSMNVYRLWGKVEGEMCAMMVWNLSHTIAITNFENTGTHQVVIHQPDNSTLNYDVEILP